MTLRTVLLSLQALLAAPEPDDPQDAVVARQYQVKHIWRIMIKIRHLISLFSWLD